MAQERQQEEKVRKMRHDYYFLTQNFFRDNEKKKTVDAKVARFRQKRRRKAISSDKDKGHGGANHLQQDDVAPVSCYKKIFTPPFVTLIIPHRCKGHLPRAPTRVGERPRSRSAETA